MRRDLKSLPCVCVTPNTKCLKWEISKPGGEDESKPFQERCEFVEGALCTGDISVRALYKMVRLACRRQEQSLHLCPGQLRAEADPCSESLLKPVTLEFLGVRWGSQLVYGSQEVADL